MVSGMRTTAASDVPRILTGVAAACAGAAACVDLVGLAAGSAAIWGVGSWLHLGAAAVLGLALVAAGGLAAMRVAHRRSPGVAPRAVVAVLAFTLLALGRWIRGHPGVPPDLPIVVATAVAAALLIAVARRAP